MHARAVHWLNRSLLLAIIIALASGTPWADAQLAPPLKEIPAAGPGPAWQEFLAYRESLRWTGGVIQALILLLIVAHFAVYGYHHVKPTGRMVKRYSWKEVFFHGLLALSFIGAWASSTYLILAKYVLGYAEQELAVPFGQLSSTVHIATGLLFLGTLLALELIWRPGMRFASYDRDWLGQLGGYFSRKHRMLVAGRFNAGQKIWFRLSVLLGVLVSLSGAVIYYPGFIGRQWDIVLYIFHTALAVALSAAVIVHVYVAVLLHLRAVGSMITGKVDEACVREDHPLELLPTATKKPSM